MDDDDIIYLYILSFSVAFGHFYKKVKNKENKKWIGSSVGIVILVLVLRIHIWYTFLMFLANSIIILWLPKRYCHLASFAYTFTHLFFTRTNTTYYGNPSLPHQTNLTEMIMTLKLVGLAFEVNHAYMSKKEQNKKDAGEDSERNCVNPKCIDIFHYTFNFMGILTGPYYTYKTFTDYFNLPFSVNAHYYQEIKRNISYMLIYTSLYTVGSKIWPISYAMSEEFYVSRSWLYRLWYSWPLFIIFRLHLYAGVLFTETVYIATGLGAYPTTTQPKPGHGPTKNFQQMKEIATKSIPELTNEKYSFETIHNINPYNVEVSVTAREGMKNWNICVQYWLVVTVYKRFPYKQFRTWATMLVSALWHGMYTGYYICIGCVPFYLAVEDTYVNLFLKDNKEKSLKIWKIIIWLIKMTSYSYLAVAFHLLEVNKCLLYYKSTHFAIFIAWGILYIIGMAVLRLRREKRKTS